MYNQVAAISSEPWLARPLFCSIAVLCCLCRALCSSSTLIMSSPSDVIPAQEPQEVPAAHEEDDADSVVAIETPVDVPAKPARGPRRKQVRRTSKKVLEDEVMEDPAHDASAQHLPDETKDHDEDMVHQEMVEDLTPRPRYKSFRCAMKLL